MTDPDPQIRGRGGGGGGGVGVGVEVGASSPKKKIVSALRASFWSKNKGGPSGPNLNPNPKNKGRGLIIIKQIKG